MKNYLIFPVFFSFLFFSKQDMLYAQESNVIGTVIYQFHHVTDTTNPYHAWNEKMDLSFYDKRSLYTSYSKREQAELIRQNTKEAKANGSNVVTMKAFGPITTERIFTYPDDNERYMEEQFHLDHYIIKETLPVIKWQIKQETKYIKGYNCQKAIGTCKGRSYTAWFTSDIPVSFGPWKLHGLPGLILEAYDANKWITFTCTQIEIGKTDITAANLVIPSGTNATQEQYNSMINASKLGIVGNIINGGTGDIQVKNEKITGLNGQPVKIRSKNLENYPLELD